MLHPAFSSAARLADTGPMPMNAGSTPQVAQDAIRPSTGAPRFAASSADISTSAPAPSLIPLALPAVTVPSFLKAGRRAAIASIVAPARMRSEEHTTELQSLLRLSYAVFCFKQKTNNNTAQHS